MKTIDELVGEVAKNLGAKKTEPKQKAKAKTEDVKPDAMQKISVNPKATAAENNFEKINLNTAKEIVKAVETAAEIIGINVVVSVCNEGANLIILHAMDDSYIASIRASQDKAYTAAALKMPTHIALKESRGGSLDGFTNGNGILLLGGGFPLKKSDKIYGGVGVSGGTKEQDTLLAAVAAAYFETRF